MEEKDLKIEATEERAQETEATEERAQETEAMEARAEIIAEEETSRTKTRLSSSGR